MTEVELKDSIIKTDVNNDLACNSSTLVFSSMSKFRIIKNLLVLSLGFMLLFSAYMALANLQSTMNNAESIGVVSQSAIYVTLIFSSLFLPKLFIKKFGLKLSIVGSSLMYPPYIAANFYPTMFTLIPTAIIIGTGAGILWPSSSAYINELSFMDAKGDYAKATLSTSRFFGIFTMFLQTTQIWGNLVSFYVLNPSDITAEIHYNISKEGQDGLNQNISCGAEFCGGVDEALNSVPDNQRSILIAIFLAFSLLTGAVFFLFLDPLKNEDTQIDDSSIHERLAATFIHIRKDDQLLLAILNTFVGLQQGFVFADYSEAYVACVLGLQSVGLVFVCFGIINAITAVTAGKLLKYVPRPVMMVIASASNISVCIALFCWKPNIQQISVFYILISFWGFSDAIWHTQLYALYGVLFRNDEEAAFASYMVFEALGYMIAFACSSYVCTSSKILLLIAFLIAGMAGYTALIIKTNMKK